MIEKFDLYLNEKTTDCMYKVISKIFVSAEINQMSLLSLLFSIWIGSNTKIWCFEGEYFGCLENSKM